MQPSENKNKFYYGFDYLRAIMIVAIIFWHNGFFGRLEVFKIERYCKQNISISDIICTQFLMLGVPVFFLISLFLFSINLKKKKGYFFPRFERLVYLYLFWTGLWCLIFFHKGFKVFPEVLQQNPKALFCFIATGGVSVFWYLFTLLLLTIISWLCIQIAIPKSLLWLLLISSTLLLWIGPYIGITQTSEVFYWIQWWVPIIHLPYVFIAILAAQYVTETKMKLSISPYILIAGILLIMFIVTSFCEWKWILNRCMYSHFGKIPTYARISVVVGASLFFCLSFLIKDKPNKLIKFLSDYSLGLYCLHPFVQLAWNEIAGEPKLKFNFIYMIGTLILAILGAYLFRRAMNKGLI